MHFIGVVSSHKRGGADSPYLSVGEGDDALGCATCKVGRGALIVCVVGRPAVPAAPIIGVVAGLVSRVLTVAFEAVDVGWERSLVLSKGAAWWGPQILHHSSFKTIFSFTVFWVTVGGSLCCVDARDNAAGRGPGTGAKEVGN